jgi:hypothetical protein
METTAQLLTDLRIIGILKFVDSLSDLTTATRILDELLNKSQAEREAKVVEFAARLVKEAKLDNANATYDNVVKAWMANETRYTEQVQGFKAFKEAVDELREQIVAQVAQFQPYAQLEGARRLRTEQA